MNLVGNCQLRRALLTETMSSVSEANINYESDALMQVELEGTEYRLDVGKEGTAMCISYRASGSWDWQLSGEAKWDGTLLKSKALPRLIVERIGRALREHLRDMA